MSNPIGRPSLYTPELMAKAQEYVDGAWEEGGEVTPTLAGLALHLGVNKDTIQAWKKDPEKAEFSVLAGTVMLKQERMLFAGGLKNDFNASIVKLALTKHGYTDRQDIDQHNTGNVGIEITRRVIDERPKD